MPYTYLQFGALKALLAARLADPNERFWTNAEKGIFLCEALRMWNALTGTWKTEFAFNVSSDTWFHLGTKAGSPRLRTVTDADIYRQMQYHLLEPPTGAGIWTGTTQFALADLQAALQKRRDELIQYTNCNLSPLSVASSPNVMRVRLPDTVLEAHRVRFLPASGLGLALTLTREDNLAFDYFETDHRQTPQIPQGWSLVTEPPLAFAVDTPPNVAGRYDVLALQAGATFAPPAATVLGIPDDFAWVAKWGALADLLGRESEATDRLRAQYCLKRFADGKKLLAMSPWLGEAQVNGVPVDTPSLAEMDAFAPEWDTAYPEPTIVNAGIDCVGYAGPENFGALLTVTGNAPVPVLDTDNVQVSRDTLDAILDEAQFLCAFKCGGAEFQQSAVLEQRFVLAASEENMRLRSLGVFADVLAGQGQRESVVQQRYGTEK